MKSFVYFVFIKEGRLMQIGQLDLVGKDLTYADSEKSANCVSKQSIRLTHNSADNCGTG